MVMTPTYMLTKGDSGISSRHNDKPPSSTRTIHKMKKRTKKKQMTRTKNIKRKRTKTMRRRILQCLIRMVTAPQSPIPLPQLHNK